jgi:hypothetical protein
MRDLRVQGFFFIFIFIFIGTFSDRRQPLDESGGTC